MKFKKIENTSNHDITLIHIDGLKQVLSPGYVAENTNIVNLDEIKRDVTVTHDLSEVIDR